MEDVALPNWASSPEDFIRKHREALVRKGHLVCKAVTSNKQPMVSTNFEEMQKYSQLRTEMQQGTLVSHCGH